MVTRGRKRVRARDESQSTTTPKRQKRRGRNRGLLLTGATAGAAFTYFFDPDQGRRRRAQLRDKLDQTRRETAETADIIVRDSRNRSRGLLFETERLLRNEEPSKGRIEHQVNATIAATSRHSRAIRARVDDGRVTLTGPILAVEVDAVRAAVSRVEGVEEIDDQLEVYEMPGDIPALQGDGRITGAAQPELLQKHWAPAPRAFAGALGGALLAYGVGRRGLTGIGAASGGGLLLARAATNEPVRHVTGIGAGPNAVEIDKSIHIDAPVDKVWEICEDYESFPTFMSHVRDVREEGDGLSHWKVDGPLGSCVEWDAEVTEIRPNEILAWRSRPGSAVQHTGEVALEPVDGGSRLHVRLAYNPAVGVAGHTVARLFGADAKKQLDDDLLRMKTTIETGKPPRDAAQAPA